MRFSILALIFLGAACKPQSTDTGVADTDTEYVAELGPVV